MFIKITIQGASPLLMNAFTDAASTGTSTAHVGSKGTPREQAARKVYADESGNLFIPGPNIFSCLIAAGKFHKSGKSKVTTLKTSLIPAGITVTDLACLLGTKKFEVDSRSVVIPATGGRIMCHRPRLDQWQTTFTLDLDETLFSPQFVRSIVDDAGKKVGLGDFRPDRKGPFGRFVVTKWVEDKNSKLN